jgi:hypothetical protein
MCHWARWRTHVQQGPIEMFIADGRGGLGRLFFDATNPDSAHHHPNVVERFLLGSREQIGYTTQPPIPMHSHVGRFILGKRPPQEALRLCPKRFLISRRGLTNFLAATRASDGDLGVILLTTNLGVILLTEGSRPPDAPDLESCRVGRVPTTFEDGPPTHAEWPMLAALERGRGRNN